VGCNRKTGKVVKAGDVILRNLSYLRCLSSVLSSVGSAKEEGPAKEEGISEIPRVSDRRFPDGADRKKMTSNLRIRWKIV